MNRSRIREGAEALVAEYGAAAHCVAADRAEFAFDRRDFVQQRYWVDVYDLVRRLPPAPIRQEEVACLTP